MQLVNLGNHKRDGEAICAALASYVASWKAVTRHERVCGFAQQVDRGAGIQLVVQIQAIEQGL